MGRNEMSSEAKYRFPAIEVVQGKNQRLYSFSVNGKMLHHFASVSRIRRDDAAELQGYQRPEVMSHINEIRAYLESDEALLPNALVVAFDSRVYFESNDSEDEAAGLGRSGHLVIPCEEGLAESEKPGWLVDGQQRAAAIRDARVDSFPVFVTAFVTDCMETQRSQFILVNSTKPLPKGLIYELLPVTGGRLPTRFERRQYPALLLTRLNHDADSPLQGMIQTPTCPEGVIKDNSILRMLEHSLSDGVLYRFRNPQTGECDTEQALGVLKTYWTAVSEVFSDAWGLRPRRSRLMHGVGVISLGYLMDAICERFREREEICVQDFADDLRPLKDVCRWTNGFWDFGPQDRRKWNELQNVSRDIDLLASYLSFEYRSRVWNKVGIPAGV